MKAAQATLALRRLLKCTQRSAHAFAHVCVCAVVLLSSPHYSSVPLPLLPSVAPVSEAEFDIALQRAATSALGGREGAVVVMDARTGRLRAVVNSHLAFDEATAPGSTIKVFTELSAFEESLLDEKSRSLCRGRYEGGGLTFNCSHPPHQPPFDSVQALAYSCNNYFGKVGERFNGERFKRTLVSFGFGVRTGIDEREAPGALPRGDVGVSSALGESRELLVTPIQLITSYTALVNGGRLLTPQRAGETESKTRERARLDVTPEHRDLLLAGMRGAVTYGTAGHAGLGTLPIYVFGKTGTSTPLDDFRPQGFFVGFAADRKPAAGETPPPESIGLAVIVLLKRSHGSDGAAAARPIFEEYARLLRRQSEGVAEKRETREAEARESPRSPSPFFPFSPTSLSVHLAREDATLRLSLDDYVFGVLAAEGSVEDELEALKAQAIVSRTYALKNLRRHVRDGYDLCSSTHCQRYMVVRDEERRPEFYELVRRAVGETSGEIIRDREGHIAEAYFSASCGGATSDIASLWGIAQAPAHLRGTPDEFCSGMPHRSWSEVITYEQLLRALRSDARSDVGGRLDGVRVIRRDGTGRAEMVLLEGERQRRIRGWDFKIIVGRELGWKVLKSSRFEVGRAGRNFVFRGAGFGHGLGLCQSGAHVMARRGVSYRQILEFYLPGASIGRIDDRSQRERAREIGDGNRTAANIGFEQAHIRSGASGASNLTQGSSIEFAISNLRFEIQNTSLWFTNSMVRTVADNFNPLRSEISNFKSQISNFKSQIPGFLDMSSLAPRVLHASYLVPAPPPRLTMSSEHFRVSYPARVSKRDVEAALRTLELSRADLLRRLAAASLNASTLEAELFVHDTTGDFSSATGQPPWVAATTRGRRIESQPLETLQRRGLLQSTLRHELVHVAAEALSFGRAPRWLVEGMAIHVAGEGRLHSRLVPKSKPSLDEIERGLELPGSAREMHELYGAAYREVLALITIEGEISVWRRIAGQNHPR